jgi:hypothetical protein
MLPAARETAQSTLRHSLCSGGVLIVSGRPGSGLGRRITAVVFPERSATLLVDYLDWQDSLA